MDQRSPTKPAFEVIGVLTPDAVVVVHAECDLETRDRLIAAFHEHCITNLGIRPPLLVFGGMAVLDETEMAALGWVRV